MDPPRARLARGVPRARRGASFLRRGRRGESVAAPDRLHIHHRLQSFGLDPRQTCYVFYSATALLGTVGLMMFGHRRILAVVLVAAVGALLGLVLFGGGDVTLLSGTQVPFAHEKNADWLLSNPICQQATFWAGKFSRERVTP